WGGAGRCGGGRAGKGGEDGLPGKRILHDGDDSPPAATAGAGEDVEGEHGAHQWGPGPRARGAGGGGAGAGLEVGRVGVRGRTAVADGLAAPAGMWGEDAVIQNQVHRGPGDDGREFL